MKYRVQVHTYGDPKGSWAGNAITHDKADDAVEAAKDLFQRWTAVEFWRVIDDQELVHKEGP